MPHCEKSDRSARPARDGAASGKRTGMSWISRIPATKPPRWACQATPMIPTPEARPKAAAPEHHHQVGRSPPTRPAAPPPARENNGASLICPGPARRATRAPTVRRYRAPTPRPAGALAGASQQEEHRPARQAADQEEAQEHQPAQGVAPRAAGRSPDPARSKRRCSSRCAASPHAGTCGSATSTTARIPAQPRDQRAEGEDGVVVAERLANQLAGEKPATAPPSTRRRARLSPHSNVTPPPSRP